MSSSETAVSNTTPALVSVIVASYNHAGYLKARMDSLIAQTYSAIEIIVIDDCSTDDSVSVLREYETHPNVKLVINTKNGGWVNVSNQGAALAQGEYIIFANCDDACKPNMIDALMSSMQANPSAGIVFCRSILIDENSNVIGDDYHIREPDFKKQCAFDILILRDQMNRYLMHSCVIPNLSAAIFRKNTLVKAGGFTTDYRVCADWDLFFKVVKHADVAYVASSLNLFRQHQTTVRSSTKDKVVYEEYLRLLLSRMQVLNFSYFERIKLRTHVMYLWTLHIFAPSLNGLLNFPYHLQSVLSYDALALLLLPVAIIKRVLILLLKLPKKLYTVFVARNGRFNFN